MKKLKSMTGFGTAQTTYNNNEIVCEIRSLNSRFLEMNIKLPRMMADLENSIKEIIRGKVDRGKIGYSLSFSSSSGELQSLKIDPQTVQTYFGLLSQIKEIAGLDTPIELQHLLSFKDLISFEEDNSIDETLLATLKELTAESLDKLNEMRSQEGDNLEQDILHRLDMVEKLTTEVSELGKDNPRKEFDKLYQRLMSLMDEEKIDRTRLEQELALISDKVDITEETVRMKSHLNLFRENLKKGSPVGKKLNFILQEMHREANTMANKTTLVPVAHRVVTIKEEIEKLREQIQNIE